MPVSFINHNQKEILYVDHRNLTGDQMLTNMKDAVKKVFNSGRNDNLMLADFREAFFSNEVTKYLQSEEVKKFSEQVSKQAIIGIKGIKKLVFNTYNAFTGKGAKIFNTIDEAKTYLTS